MGENGRIAFVWGQFGPYHMDRCEAVAAGVGDYGEVIGIEVAAASEHYAWSPTGAGQHFRKVTLIPGRSYSATRWWERLIRLARATFKCGARHVFICHASDVEYFLTAVLLRLAGRRVYVMSDSKFDDLPRNAWRELARKILYLPYTGALVGGARARAYMRFLGFRDAAIQDGYDTVSIARIRALAGQPPAPEGVPFTSRHFIAIARFVPKKNLGLLLDAYARYRELAGDGARGLVVCGGGPLEAELRARAAALDGVEFAVFVQADGVAKTLAGALALILPSIGEQWGLVVNEALAMGVPALVTDRVGARDKLVRAGVDGYLFEPDNADGLAHLMHRIATDEAEWRRLSEGTARFVAEADAARFAEGVSALTGL